MFKFKPTFNVGFFLRIFEKVNNKGIISIEGNNMDWQKIKNDYTSKSTYDLLKFVIIYIFGPFFPWLSALFLHHLPFLKNFSRLSIGIDVAIILLIIFVAYRFYMIGKERLQLLNSSGLFYFGKNVSYTDRLKNEKLLLENIKNSRTIQIIGATGYNTFARDDAHGKAILRDALEKAEGEIKILLMHPDERFTKMRAQCLSVPYDTYRNEFLNSLRFLKELKNKGKNINLKLYSQKPIWKMIILDNFLWLQYYHSHTHVEKMPVYGISNSSMRGEYNLFSPLYAVFEKKWLHDGNPTFDFNTDEIVYDPVAGSPSKRMKIRL